MVNGCDGDGCDDCGGGGGAVVVVVMVVVWLWCSGGFQGRQGRPDVPNILTEC